MENKKTSDENKNIEKKNLPKPAVKADDKGLLVGSSLEEQFRIAKLHCESKLLPARFDTPAKVLTAMQYARELGLKPLSALRQIAIINGTPCIYGDLPLGIVRQSGLLEYIREYLIAEDGIIICMKNKNINAKPWGAVCVVKRKDDDHEIERSFTMEEARNAKLDTKEVWRHYGKTMLKYRARGAALHDTFPDVLSGIAISEYHYNEIPRDDNSVVVATSDEVREDIDKTMTDYKKEKIIAINECLKELRKIDPGWTDGCEVQMFNEIIKTQELTFATEKNLDILHKHICECIDFKKAEKTNES